MERLKNLSEINTNTIEGRLLIAALSKLSGSEHTDIHPDEILEKCQELAEKIYKDADDITSSIVEPKTFDKELESLINKFSMENGSNTPDYLLANYLIGCLEIYNKTLTARDKWFGVDVWEDTIPNINKV